MGTHERFGAIPGALIACASEGKDGEGGAFAAERRPPGTIGTGHFASRFRFENSFSGVRQLPLYPYRCTQCGHRFEKIQHFSDEPEKACPECGGALERPLTVPGLSFKGAGWYVNDYAPKSGSASGDGAGTEKKTETKPETKSEGKAETKTESKSESSTSSPAPSPQASSGTSTGSSS